MRVGPVFPPEGGTGAPNAVYRVWEPAANVNHLPVGIRKALNATVEQSAMPVIGG